MRSFESTLTGGILLSLIACASGPTQPEGREVLTTVTVPAKPEQVIRAFLDADALHGWWKVSRSLVEDHPGGTWAITWDDYGEEKTTHVWTGVIEQLSDQHLLIGDMVMVEPDYPLFGPMQLELHAEPADLGTRLSLAHRGYQEGENWDQMHQTVVEGWNHVLGDLQDWFTAR
ncbi:MAG: SRPBCC family protein [Planctomycetota bacterium]|jgi:uncharacterized protein YndB with AHSA1/START domain